MIFFKKKKKEEVAIESKAQEEAVAENKKQEENTNTNVVEFKVKTDSDYLNDIIKAETMEEYMEALQKRQEYWEKRNQKIIDEMNRQVSGKPLKNNNGVKGKAYLEVRSCINDACSAYDSSGLCNVMQCLKCENAYYKITLEDGSIVSNNEEAFENTNIKVGFKEDDHDILFYDYVPTKDELLDYLDDKKSQYRVVRLFDNMVMNDYVGEFNRDYKERKLVKLQKHL